MVYEDLSRAETLRQQLIGTGTDLWSARAGSLSQFLCTWNAFVLQVIGDELVEADYSTRRSTVGYLSPATAEQAAAFLGEVGHWSVRARRAAADPRYDVGAELSLPAALPAWVEVEPCPRGHLDAMLSAARTIGDHAATALADFTRATTMPEKTDVVDRVTELVADADGFVAYAEAIWSPAAATAVHEAVERSIKGCIESYYLIGQVLAMPTLLDRPAALTAMVTGPRLPLPGEQGFDPWCLTNPATHAEWRRDPAACRAIDRLWRCDPDPGATLTIQARIDAAVGSGAVVRSVMATGELTGSYCRCPWSAVHLVRSPVVIAGRRLRTGDQFAFDVSAEEVAEGGAFKREIVLGPFHPTGEIDNSDLTPGGHRD